MEMKKYKLEDICLKITDGSHFSPKPAEHGYPMFSVKDMGEFGFSYSDAKLISKEDFEKMKSSGCVPQKNDVLVAKDGSYLKESFVCTEGKDEAILSSVAIFRPNTTIVDPYFLAYLFKTPSVYKYVKKGCVSGTALPRIVLKAFKQIELYLPQVEKQKKISSVLLTIDDKIALNRRMNAKLEQMAKRLYDYWFVQFDFPNADGKPYKASGGKMVWNEPLKREIPDGWEVKSISSLIKENIGGDWGKEELTGNYQLKVSCCRGSDIESMTNLPTRYILNSNSSKLLEENDMVVEISGGSPTQATGRCVLISKEILNSFDNKLICSNFCQALSISEKDYVSYFYHMWKMFYDSDIFFNFEGKTSGIKNFQYDTFVAEKWYFPPKELAAKFGEIVSKNYKMKCALDKENKQLTSLRDKLLPLLMNGQVEVK